MFFFFNYFKTPVKRYVACKRRGQGQGKCSTSAHDILYTSSFIQPMASNQPHSTTASQDCSPNRASKTLSEGLCTINKPSLNNISIHPLIQFIMQPRQSPHSFHIILTSYRYSTEANRIDPFICAVRFLNFEPGNASNT